MQEDSQLPVDIVGPLQALRLVVRARVERRLPVGSQHGERTLHDGSYKGGTVQVLYQTKSMERLRALILRLANAERVGGRASIVDGQTIILYDCTHWGSHCTDAVAAQFPEVQISVRACRQSLSGFTVIFHRAETRLRELAWFLVIGLGLACCTYILLRPPWWASRILPI